jgi:hypothetical protein
LYSKIGRLEMENDFLKKKSAEFSWGSSCYWCFRFAVEFTTPMPSSWQLSVNILLHTDTCFVCGVWHDGGFWKVSFWASLLWFTSSCGTIWNEPW